MKRRVLSVLLCLCTAFAMIPTISIANGADSAIKFGANGIGKPTVPTNTSAAWQGSYVYFGTYNKNPVKYRVLDSDTSVFGRKTMLLDCDTVLWTDSFDGSSNVWANSGI